ncbi:hypothetical protein [Streptomyces sp. NPDC021139]|uniref:hypothetical protein n=1 Tax=unclassified Streptomyces TaxID=2593676 RepID=UPI0034028C41
MSDSKTRRARLTLAALGVLTVSVLVGGGITAAMVLGDDDSAGGTSSSKPTTTSPSQSGSSQQPGPTPETADKLKLQVPTGQKDGLSTGFSEGPAGAISTAVYFWEEYAFLDDQKARQQLEAIVSPDAEGYVDEQISQVRKLRENIGLPPSGGTPAGVTFTTTVNAVRPTSLDPSGKVVQIWINFDRYATQADGSPDDAPLKDQTTDLILKLQDGAWKITNESAYWEKRSFARGYFADSRVSYADGWRQVLHAD